MRSGDTEALIYNAPVILVGGGEVRVDLVERFAKRGWSLVCADGGADGLAGDRLTPETIVGDMDSIEDKERWQSCSRFIQIDEQDTTDFEKCLYTVKAPLYLAVGFTGNRFDHTLASLNALCKYVANRKVIMLAGDDICFACSSDLALTLVPGQRFSIYPLLPCRFVSSSGLLYPLNNLLLKPGGMVGTSNSTTAGEVSIQLDFGTYLVILPVSSLDDLVDNLLSKAF